MSRFRTPDRYAESALDSLRADNIADAEAQIAKSIEAAQFRQEEQVLTMVVEAAIARGDVSPAAAWAWVLGEEFDHDAIWTAYIGPAIDCICDGRNP